MRTKQLHLTTSCFTNRQVTATSQHQTVFKLLLQFTKTAVKWSVNGKYEHLLPMLSTVSSVNYNVCNRVLYFWHSISKHNMSECFCFMSSSVHISRSDWHNVPKGDDGKWKMKASSKLGWIWNHNIEVCDNTLAASVIKLPFIKAIIIRHTPCHAPMYVSLILLFNIN